MARLKLLPRLSTRNVLLGMVIGLLVVNERERRYRQGVPLDTNNNPLNPTSSRLLPTQYLQGSATDRFLSSKWWQWLKIGWSLWGAWKRPFHFLQQQGKNAIDNIGDKVQDKVHDLAGKSAWFSVMLAVLMLGILLVSLGFAHALNYWLNSAFWGFLIIGLLDVIAGVIIFWGVFKKS